MAGDAGSVAYQRAARHGDEPSMTSPLDRSPIEHRLITMRRSVDQLGSLEPLDRSRLESDPAIGLVIERTLALLDDLAFAINSYVSAAVTSDAPRTSAASFGAAEQAGLIDSRLATALTPPDGQHNILVQLYLDNEPEKVPAILSAALTGYREYMRQVVRWTESGGPAE
jgi:uncharacterized protein YutE (UPF0331/DUF86 family)